MKEKILFEGKIKASVNWVGTMFQQKSYKDKFGIIKKGESRYCALSTEWGTLQISNYKDVNKFVNKKVKVIIKIID